MMEAGRGLDALVAEKVMGWPSITFINGCPFTPCDPDTRTPYKSGLGVADLPFYSTEIATAWEVVERIAAKHTEIDGKLGDWWEVGLCVENAVTTEWDWHFGREATLPHAICLAALQAVGVEVG